MSCLYILEQGARVTVGDGKFIVESKNGMKTYAPQETLESIMIFGAARMEVAAQKACLERGVRVSFLSTRGRYYGRLESTSHFNPARLKKQVYLSDHAEKCLELGKKILKAKVHNQLVILRRYERNSPQDIQAELRNISIYESKIYQSQSIQAIMGYEGMAAREYFRALSKMIRPEFAFSGRSRRPPKDAFNSLISLGYTIVFYEIFAEIECKSLSPYIGFIHKIKERHPALASDLLEEWRAVLVDATVLSLIQGNEIAISDFVTDPESGAVIISNDGVKMLVSKLEKKMRADIHYLEYLDHPVSFRRAIWWQVQKLAGCIDREDFSEYTPIRIR